MVKHLAIEAAALTEKLIRWSEQHADSVESSDMLTMRAWYAWSLLHADRHAEALKIYDECLTTDPERLPAPSALRTEIRLGRAQCLLQLDRPDEALPIFTEIWHTSFEHSPDWWQAFVGSLEAHTRLGSSPERIIQSIRQQELLAPDLGGPRYKHRLKQIETANNTKMGKQPAPNPDRKGGDSNRAPRSKRTWATQTQAMTSNPRCRANDQSMTNSKSEGRNIIAETYVPVLYPVFWRAELSTIGFVW